MASEEVVVDHDFEFPHGDDATQRAVVAFAVKHVVEFKGAEEADEDIVIDVLAGGITNKLYRIHRKSTRFSVVARCYGKETERLISRNAELFWQSAFLRTYARCKNGILYEYLDGFIPLEPEDCPTHADQIARTMGRLHRDAAARSLYSVPYGTQPLFTEVALVDWIELATSDESLSKIKERGHDVTKRYGDLDRFVANAARLRQAIASVAHLVPVAPCHNDLLSGNIMLCQKTREIRFIDFEYMRRNYYLGDVANHFCEYAGFECDWQKLPSRGVQQRYIQEYLGVTMENDRQKDRDAAERRAMVLLPLFELLAHYVWAGWALVQGAHSEIDFDYVEFGGKRYARYLATCEEAYADAAALVAEEKCEV
jgi:ethanolamine kinase